MKRIVLAVAAVMTLAVAGYAVSAHASYCTTHCYNIGDQRFCSTSCI